MSNVGLDEFVLTVDDSLPSLEYTITRSGSGSTTPNLAGFTVNLKVREKGSTANSFTLAVTSSGGDDGQITSIGSSSSGATAIVRFDWSTGNWSSSGSFLGEVSFSSTGDKIETAPNRQLFVIDSQY